MVHLIFTFIICAIVAIKCSWARGIGSYGQEVPIPAKSRTNYNIREPNGFGTYKFGYDTGPGPSRSFREEEKTADGTVRGHYGYIDPRGKLRVVEYISDWGGYRVLKSGYRSVKKAGGKETKKVNKPTSSAPSFNVITRPSIFHPKDINSIPTTPSSRSSSPSSLPDPSPFTKPSTPSCPFISPSSSPAPSPSSSPTRWTRVPFYLKIPVESPGPFIGPLPPFIRKRLNLNQIFENSLKSDPELVLQLI